MYDYKERTEISMDVSLITDIEAILNRTRILLEVKEEVSVKSYFGFVVESFTGEHLEVIQYVLAYIICKQNC